MAQHDYVIDNGPGLAVRTDINAMAAAIQSSNSGTVEPAAKVPGQIWFNTTTGALSLRNAGNTAWTPIGGLSTDGLTLYLKEGATVRGSVASDGGASAGTTALRCFNSSGAQTGLFYVNSADVGTDRNTISVYNASDQALWFRQANGVVRGGVYNYTSGRTELRAYNSGGSLVNVVGIDASLNLFSYSNVIQWNSLGAAADVWMSHRVSGTRAIRWYYAQSGDIFLQESDDNYGSHFINVIGYSRSTNNFTIPNYLAAYGVLINGAAGSNNGLFLGNGDNASYATNNIWLRSWNGIGFPSSLDGVNRIFMNTRNGDIYSQGRLQGNDIVSAGTIYTGNGSSYMQADGNIIFSGGMTSVGATLHQALSIRATVYTGDWVDETNFPLGHPVIARGGSALARNAAGTIRLGTATNAEYRYNSGTGTILAGTWRHRGYFDDAEGGVGGGLYERTA